MAKMIFENNAWHLSERWSIEDVRNVSDDYPGAKRFTDEDCLRVLSSLVEGFDANLGINWEVIGAAVGMVVNEKQGEMT